MHRIKNTRILKKQSFCVKIYLWKDIFMKRYVYENQYWLHENSNGYI